MQAVCFCVSGCFAMKDGFCEKAVPTPSMGLVYLPTFGCLFFLMVHVGKDSVRPMDAMGCVGNLQYRKAICKVGEPLNTIFAYGCFQKLWYPQIIHFDRVFHHSYHHFWKHPYLNYVDLYLSCTGNCVWDFLGW